ncbi:MAG TPA: MarP family serine protease [Solirubrobacteraceae bacterium]|nr:MarP family serine protease [Solirubrobacteraceae bacterium]
MTGLDWIILGIVLLLALFGWAQGFLAGALALAGFALGAWLGTRLAPLVLSDGARSPYAPAFGLMGALCAGAAFAAGLEGVGARVRARLRLPGLAAVDGVLGALLTACVGLGIVWILAAVAVQSTAADLRQQVQRSAILSRLNAALPPSGPLLNALGRFDPFPRIDGPEANVPPPRAGIARDADVRGVAPSVVKVLGTACGLGVEGSGWVARPGLVVTNAHVVAGQDDTRVLLRGRGPGLSAHAVAFDSRNDLAVLRVEGLGAAALPLAQNPRPGMSAAIVGFPHNGPYDVRPGRLGDTRTAVTSDAYGRGPVQRRLTSLRGVVRSGNSGGPMVDGRGRVVTTIFAATTTGTRGGYGVPNALVRRALAGAGSEVSTGPCAG